MNVKLMFHYFRRSRSRNKTRENSRERKNNQQNRENDIGNNNQNQKDGGAGGRRFDRRGARGNSTHSRESSKDRSARGNNWKPEDFQRNSRSSTEVNENWRTRRKTSTCESDESHRSTGQTSSHTSPLSSMSNSSPMNVNSNQPGILVLPDQTQAPKSSTPPRHQNVHQQKSLFDPNNPNKPIIVTSPGGRVAAHAR